MSPSPDRTLFRYMIVSCVMSRIHAGECRADAVRQVAEMEHFDQAGRRCTVSRRSIYRWLQRFEAGGADALSLSRADDRRAFDRSTLPPALIAYLIEQKQADPAASIPELIRRAREEGVVAEDLAIDRATVWRTCKKLGLTVKRVKRKGLGRDSRRFEYPHRMDMVLCDGKHFRAGPTRTKRVVMNYLDDATRKILHKVVGPSESSSLFLRGLFEVVSKYGLMQALYLDHGPGYIADDTLAVGKQLGIAVIHGEVAYPQGHGKVERYNRTFGADVLRGLDGRADVDADYRALELRFLHYAHDVYGRRSHQSLGREMSPSERFESDPKPLRLIEKAVIQRAFLIPVRRRVSNDHVVSIDGTSFEIPRGYAGREVIVYRDILDGTLTFRHRDREIEIHPVDLHANARQKRGRQQSGTREAHEHHLPKSAADLEFERDFGRHLEP